MPLDMATSFPPSICLGNPKMVSLSDFKLSSLGYVLLLNWLDFRLGLGWCADWLLPFASCF